MAKKISEKQIDLLVERLINRVEKSNTIFLKNIGSQIKKIQGLTPTKAQQLIQILKYGGKYEELINEISKYSDKNIDEIDKIFKTYAKKDQMFYKQFYDYRNKPFIPYDKNVLLQRQTKALSNIAKNEMYNFTRSNVLGYTINGKFMAMKDIYNQVLDTAFMNVGQGKETFDSAMSGILKEIGGSGLKTLEYESGRSIRLDSAVRMHLKGRLRELHNENQKLFGDEFGANGYEISVHENPAIDHADVQGKQFSFEEYEKLNNGLFAKDYKGRTYTLDHDGKNGYRPISEMNCYHYIFAVILGVNTPEYNDRELEQIERNNNRGFEYEGKHYTNYEGTQLQRALEREIRKNKDIQILARESDNKELIAEAQSKISVLINKYNELSNVSGLPKKLDRLRVNEYRRIKMQESRSIPNNNKKVIAYHSTPRDFNEFDEEHINPNDMDFALNGFFFTEQETGASPYFGSNIIIKAELDVEKMATSKDLSEVLTYLNKNYDIYDDSQIPLRSRSWEDEVRHLLEDKGFHGMQTRGVNYQEAKKVFETANVYNYKTLYAGESRKLVKDEYNNFKYYEGNEYIYTYKTLKEWKEDNPSEYVIFKKEYIKILNKRKK